MSVALTTGNVDAGVDALLDMSDPTSSNYGQHWNAETVLRTFNPDVRATRAVTDWLNSSGVASNRIVQSRNGGHLHFNLNVGQASRLLHAQFYLFRNRETGEERIACHSYELPDHLSHFVDFITTTAREVNHQNLRESFRRQTPGPSENITNKTVTVDCDKYTAPSCLRDLYKIPTGATPHPNNSYGIYEPAWLTWLPEDLDQFFSLFQPELVGQRPVVQSVDGGYRQFDYKIVPFNLEPDLDFEYSMALTAPEMVTNIQVGDMYRLGSLNDMLAAFDMYYCGSLDTSVDPAYPDPLPGGYNNTADCGTIIPPKVLSISWGDAEADYPPEYLRRQCLEFMKLGLMGVTVVTASGDFGTANGLAPGTCINATTGAPNATTGAFNPGWPASCPWITVVGGTQTFAQASQHLPASNTSSSTSNSNKHGPSTNETAFNTILSSNNLTLSSSGGFSNIFPAPSYQHRAVAAYQRAEHSHLSHLLPRFNPSGRGYPDVAAMAYNYLAAVDGTWQQVYGTSASTPVFASIIPLINNERLHAGKGPVGFLNPALYAHPEVLNDVTTGHNGGCGVDVAFRAACGWDPVTGLGTPDYERMRDLFVRLP